MIHYYWITRKGRIYMTKRRSKNRSNKIIPFPGLKERLLQIGTEKLENKEVEEAIRLLKQAKDIKPVDDQIQIAYVMALFEGKYYEEAKAECKDLLHRGVDDYLQVVELYLMILIQLNEYEEVVSTIHALLEEADLSMEQRTHFFHLLQLSEKVWKNRQPDTMVKIDSLMLHQQDVVEQTMQIAQLKGQNLEPYIEQLESMLKQPDGHPWVKTLILLLLKEHHYKKEMTVTKFSKTKRVIPVELPEFTEQDWLQPIRIGIEQLYEHENPTFCQELLAMLERHGFIMFPFSLSPTKPAIWIAAYVWLGNQLYGIKLSIETITEQFHINESELKHAISFLQQLEEWIEPTNSLSN
jgi:tetratricopeptide (TPR) repeat protein